MVVQRILGRSGIIRRLEEKLQRLLQWVVFQLHNNDIGLGHLFEEVDDKTSGPSGFSGQVVETVQIDLYTS